MKRACFFLFLIFLLPNILLSQTVATLINQVSQAGIVKMVRDFSGEDSTFVSSNKVLIRNRVSASGNNLAADYLNEKLTSYGLPVQVINYSAGGRNIVAKQIGTVNPDSIYIICAHYDAVANYGADDNASGVVAVLESARILSNYNFENTIIYAFWDEEEIGLKGARNYANTAKANNNKIVGVVNMDMIGYDGNNDGLFDIDVRNIANSYQIKNDLVSIVSNYSLNLVSSIVDPGTLDSDHSAFWTVGYSAVLLGEAWSVNDITPTYHTSGDRISLFNINYFYNMVKLCVGYISTKGVLVTTTGMELAQKSNYRLYPNPAHNNVTIDFGKPIRGQFELFNVYGASVTKQPVNGEQFKLNLTGLSNGFYLVYITDEHGNTDKLKLIKE